MITTTTTTIVIKIIKLHACRIKRSQRANRVDARVEDHRAKTVTSMSCLWFQKREKRPLVSGYDSFERPLVSGYESFERPLVSGYESFERPLVSGYDSFERPLVSGYESFQRPLVSGYESFQRPLVSGYESLPCKQFTINTTTAAAISTKSCHLHRKHLFWVPLLHRIKASQKW